MKVWSLSKAIADVEATRGAEGPKGPGKARCVDLTTATLEMVLDEMLDM